jgi:oxygen-independent coproporphyrinogen III oxidase
MGENIVSLLAKYDVATPRYTSYPTVPYWDFSTLDDNCWKDSVIKTFNSEKGELCIYIHLPFCESLCTFCACNKRITKNHTVERSYIDAVLKEWQMYLDILPGVPIIKEIHLGGGTPTFFSADNLVYLINEITNDCAISADHEFSIEIHPNFTKEEHLSKLAAIGFDRMSIGVQDFDPQIQYSINRIQSYDQTKEVFDWGRKYNFKSINIDLIYGLPHQTIQSVEHTIKLIKTLMPDRIAFYSYAHVPWKSKAQRRYTESDLPPASVKWAIYNRGRALLEQAGFKSIGMDHFALPGDQLFIAAEEGNLHRNFMGYTTTQSKLIIGLGASSISATKNAFAQNEKVVEEYEAKIDLGKLPLINGHLLNQEDILIQGYIHELMCLNQVTIQRSLHDIDFVVNIFKKLKTLKEDGLVEVEGDVITVTTKGKLFIRNICAAFDGHLFKKEITGLTFSKAI